MARRTQQFDPLGPWPNRTYPASRQLKRRGYDPYRQYRGSNAAMTRHYTRLFHPESVKWGKPESDSGPGVLSFGQQESLVSRPRTVGWSVFGTKPISHRVDATTGQQLGGVSVSGRDIVWVVLAAGATYGLVAAKSRRGYTPLLFAGLAAVVMAKALKGTWDEAVYERLGW